MRPWVEVEELPVQSLAPRTKSRVPLTGVIAVGAVVVLLAAGFGLLGGRTAGPPGSSPPASLVAGRPSTAPTATEPPPVPRVTPWTACGDHPDQPPEALLEVDGHPTAGHVEPLDFSVFRTFNPDPSFGTGELPDVAEVPMDAITEIWVVGGACAVAWTIDLVGKDVPGGLQTLESQGNEHRDPATSAQNRFKVFVAPFAGDHELRAILVFEELVVRMTWPIHVPALDEPRVRLTAANGEIPMAMGCDVTQRIANDVEVLLAPCDRDLQRAPGRRVEVAPGEILAFAIEDWAMNSTFITCGLLADRRFFPRTQPPCERDQDPFYAGVRFPAPEEVGPSTLAMTTCAVRIRVTGNGFDELCGTWYANVVVRE